MGSANDGNSTTSVSLLVKLKDWQDARAAWERFVRLYGKAIHAWCRHRCPHGSEDASQEVLLRLFERLRTFEYDPQRGRFRGWLNKFTNDAISDYLERWRKTPGGEGSGNDAIIDQLGSVESREELAKRLENEYDLELLEIVMEEVRQRIEPHTWKCFELQRLKGIDAKAVAAQLGLERQRVYTFASRVQEMIREALAQRE